MGAGSSTNSTGAKSMVSHQFCVPDITFDSGETSTNMISCRQECPIVSGYVNHHENPDNRIGDPKRMSNERGNTQQVHRSSDSIDAAGLKRLKLLGFNKRSKDIRPHKRISNRLSLVETNNLCCEPSYNCDGMVGHDLSKSLYQGSTRSSTGLNSSFDVPCLNSDFTCPNAPDIQRDSLPDPRYLPTCLDRTQIYRQLRRGPTGQFSDAANTRKHTRSNSTNIDGVDVFVDDGQSSSQDVHSLTTFCAVNANSSVSNNSREYVNSSHGSKKSYASRGDRESKSHARTQLYVQCKSTSLKSSHCMEARCPSPSFTRQSVQHMQPSTSFIVPSPENRNCTHHVDFHPYCFDQLNVDDNVAQAKPRINLDTGERNTTRGVVRKQSYQKAHSSPVVPKETPTKYGNRYKNLTKSFSCYALKFFINHQTHQRTKENIRHGSTEEPQEKSKRKHVSLKLPNKQTERQQMSGSTRALLTDDSDNISDHKMSTKDENHSMNSLDESDHRGLRRFRGTSFSLNSKRHRQRPSFEPHANVIHSVQPTKYNSVRYFSDASLKSGPKQPIPSCSHSQTAQTSINQCSKACGTRESIFDDKKLATFESRPAVLKVSTSELLRCLSYFVITRIQIVSLKLHNNHYHPIPIHHNRLLKLQPSVIVSWIKAIDRALLLQGWSDVSFLNPANVIFLFMMLKECIGQYIRSERELHTVVMACLYLSYSFTGNEISYPLKPFLVAETNQLLGQHDAEVFIKSSNMDNGIIDGFDSTIRNKVIEQVRNRFWQYCLQIMNMKSSEMLQINANPTRFTELFSELRSYQYQHSHKSSQRMASTPN